VAKPITQERYHVLTDGADLPTAKEAEEIAAVWRADKDEPGFVRPPAHLIEAVEEVLGAPIWA
jgi:hypothetical protein